MSSTIRALLDYGIERFEAAEVSFGHGTANALDEAAWLVMHAARLPPTDLARHLDRPLTAAQAKSARALIDARVRTRKPAAYLLNEAWLGPHRFYVDERVIVPRSFLAELLQPETGDRPQFPNVDNRGLSPVSVLDLCTGSGCLAILAALAFPEAQVDAVDLSADALEVARKNVDDYGLGERVRLVKSDLFGALGDKSYDFILSNPPYVKAASMKALPAEYRKEPPMALASGVDGLDHTRTILARAREHLKPDGTLWVEIGHNRKALVRAYPKLPFKWPRTSAGKGFVFELKRDELP
ncbi:MAG: 50S ribosomal protein L3 N(5)-glutamine methyltransferase [Usitatibacter sp.]